MKSLMVIIYDNDNEDYDINLSTRILRVDIHSKQIIEKFSKQTSVVDLMAYT